MTVGIVSAVLDLIFPRKCVFCQKILTKGLKGVCLQCEKSIMYTQNPRMEKRGEFYELCLSPLQYKGAVRDSILRYKFRGVCSYSETYGRLIAETVKNDPDSNCEIVTWVPVSAKRLRKRGYDQSLLIAKETAKILELPLVKALTKPRHTPPQSGINGDDKRRANVAGAYEVSLGSELFGKRVLLIDDIVTSGATLSECTRVLLMGGAETVICATLARAE